MSRAAPPPVVMPAWPALLTTELACAYTTLSEASFRAVAKLKGLEPRDVAGLAVTRWRRADLDALIDSLPARGAQMPADAPQAADPVDLALQRVKRRARG